MLPVTTGGHAAYQDFVSENLRKFYPNPDVILRSTWDIIERFWSLDVSISKNLILPDSLALAGDGTPVFLCFG